MRITVQESKVAPTTERITPPSDDLCLCKVLAPIMFIAKLDGLFHLQTTHRDGSCVFKRSWAWTTHSVALVVIYMYLLWANSSYVDFGSKSSKSYMQMLQDVVNLVYLHCAILLIILSLVQAPKYTRLFQMLSSVFGRGLFCQEARRAALTTHYSFLVFALIFSNIEFAVFYWLTRATDYEINFLSCLMELKFSQNISIVFYLIYLSIASVLLGTLACYEKLLKSTLSHVEDSHEFNNQRLLFGVYKIRLCPSHHSALEDSLLSRQETIESLRILHQDVCLAICYFNDCVNPAFLLHIIVELMAVIIEYYAIFFYMLYEFTGPLDTPNHWINCIYCVLHTMGLYVVLKNGQHLRNMMDSPKNVLLEYSTRISGEDEQRQIRIFIEKLKQHKPLTASGVFDIDLGIAGSLYANILTYVLVALQFKIPK